MIFHEPKPLNVKVGDKVKYNGIGDEFTVAQILHSSKLFYTSNHRCYNEYGIAEYMEKWHDYPSSTYFAFHKMKLTICGKDSRLVKVPNKNNQHAGDNWFTFIKKIFSLW
jgi:hypothetical protein